MRLKHIRILSVPDRRHSNNACRSARTVTGQERQQMVLFDLFAKSSAKYRSLRSPDGPSRSKAVRAASSGQRRGQALRAKLLLACFSTGGRDCNRRRD